MLSLLVNKTWSVLQDRSTAKVENPGLDDLWKKTLKGWDPVCPFQIVKLPYLRFCHFFFPFRVFGDRVPWCSGWPGLISLSPKCCDCGHVLPLQALLTLRSALLWWYQTFPGEQKAELGFKYFLSWERVSVIQAGPQFHSWGYLTLNFWFSCFCLPIAGIIGMPPCPVWVFFWCLLGLDFEDKYSFFFTFIFRL